MRLPIQACYSRNSNNSHKLLKVWEGAIWIGLFDTYTPHPKYYKPDQCSPFPALESQVAHSPCTQGLCFVTSGEVVRTPGLLLPWEKASQWWKFSSTFFRDPAQPFPSHEGSLIHTYAGSFPSFTSSRHVVYFHRSLSCENFDVQWVVDPSWTLSLNSVKSLNMPKT